jgi:hypothetical protein
MMRIARWFSLVLVVELSLVLFAVPQAGLAQPDGVAAADLVVGQPIIISELDIDEEMPAVAYDSARREFLVVWSNDRSSAPDDVYARRVSIGGQLLSWFCVRCGTVERTAPDVAYSGQHGDYLIVYAREDSGGDWDIFGQRVDIYGPQGNEFSIAAGTLSFVGSEERPTVAYNSQDDDFLVVWVEQGASGKEVWGVRVAGVADGGDGGGQLIGAKQPLAAKPGGDCTSPDVAYDSGRNRYGLVYDYISGGTEAQLRLINAEGSYIVGKQGTVNPDGEQPAVAANGDVDQYVVVYKYMGGAGGPEVWAYRTSGDLVGAVNGPLDASPGGDQLDPEIARLGDSDLYQVVWAEQHAGGRGVRGRRIDSSGAGVPAFDIYMESARWESLPAVADGSPMTLTVWEHDRGTPITNSDIAGRLLGYRVYLPLVLHDFE